MSPKEAILGHTPVGSEVESGACLQQPSSYF